MTLTDNDDLLEQLAGELRYVQLAMAQLKEQEADVKARLRDAVGTAVGTITAHGRPVLSVTYRKVFNEDYARGALPRELVELCSETVISASKAKQVLAPELYAMCQKPSDNPTFAVKAAS